MKALLMDHVQFIYELELASLEVKSLGGSLVFTNNKEVDLEGDKETLLRRTAYFKSIDGEETLYNRMLKYNVTRSINQYITHWIYPYKADLLPALKGEGSWCC